MGIRVFMLGWEFPPFISGGLGTACYGLARAMAQMGTSVTFVLPKTEPIGLGYPQAPVDKNISSGYSQAVSKHVRICPVSSGPSRCGSDGTGIISLRHPTIAREGAKSEAPEIVAKLLCHTRTNIPEDILHYSCGVTKLARGEEFDVIHAHGWKTFPAATALKAKTGKPLVVHMHSTEFERRMTDVDEQAYDIEQQGMEMADRIIVANDFSRNLIGRRYDRIDANRIAVVHSGVDRDAYGCRLGNHIDGDERIVLLLHGTSPEENPVQLVRAAEQVLKSGHNAKFVVTGPVDVVHEAIQEAARRGIADRLLFTCFLRSEAVRDICRNADLCVRSAHSTPPDWFVYGPVLADQESAPPRKAKEDPTGGARILKLGSRDVNAMARSIAAALENTRAQMTSQHRRVIEAKPTEWTDAAKELEAIYEEILSPQISCCTEERVSHAFAGIQRQMAVLPPDTAGLMELFFDVGLDISDISCIYEWDPDRVRTAISDFLAEGMSDNPSLHVLLASSSRPKGKALGPCDQAAVLLRDIELGSPTGTKNRQLIGDAIRIAIPVLPDDLRRKIIA